MLDRASTFADPQTANMLKTAFVPVAIDQAYQRRQQDTEGEFYRKIAGQGPRADFKQTTQGFYIATPSGELLLYNNNRDPKKLRRLMQEQLLAFGERADSQQDVAAISAQTRDQRYNVSPPTGGLILRAHAKVLGGYEATDDRWQKIFQTAVSRDNVWISAAEQDEIVAGKLPASVQRRLTKFHCVDNTRGEPPMWKDSEIRRSDWQLSDGKISGAIHVETPEGSRGFKADVKGYVETKNGKVVRMDMVVLGDFWGEGPYTSRGPNGKFPLAIGFTLADGSDIADGVPPQGSRGWVEGYME